MPSVGALDLPAQQRGLASGRGGMPCWQPPPVSSATHMLTATQDSFVFKCLLLQLATS
jgi:hypothetical protein